MITGRFTTRELSLLGVMTALTIVVQFTFGMAAMLFTAIPGLPNFIIGFFSAAVLYVALRKLPKRGALTIMSVVYGLVFLLMSGRTFTFLGLAVGGLAGDLVGSTLGGCHKKWVTVTTLLVFRGVASLVAALLPVILKITQSDMAVVYILAGIGGTLAGTLAGALFGDKLNGRLQKAGVMV